MGRMVEGGWGFELGLERGVEVGFRREWERKCRIGEFFEFFDRAKKGAKGQMTKNKEEWRNE